MPAAWREAYRMCEHRGAQSMRQQHQTQREASMRHVMVMNSKGGCGKSTIATNLASHFASEGYKVALADYDPQRTSLDWLEMRPADLPRIAGVAAYDEGLR